MDPKPFSLYILYYSTIVSTVKQRVLIIFIFLSSIFYTKQKSLAIRSPPYKKESAKQTPLSISR